MTKLKMNSQSWNYQNKTQNKQKSLVKYNIIMYTISIAEKPETLQIYLEPKFSLMISVSNAVWNLNRPQH